MPFFELGGKIFETEYGPITEMDVIDAIDDMTAMYIITQGDFSGFDPNAVDKITQIAHDKFESQYAKSLAVLLLVLNGLLVVRHLMQLCEDRRNTN